MKKVRFQAHRGVSSEYPENTMVAYRAAVAQGYDIIEMDVKFTSDDVCVMFHDSTINRTASVAGDPVRVDSITWEKAQQLDVGAWKGAEFAGEKIPTLRETLAYVKEVGIDCKLDNVWETFPEYRQDIFLAICGEAGLGERLGITCRKLETLAKAAAALPQAEIHWDGDNDDETLKQVEKLTQGRRRTIWVCYNNSISSWFKGARASRELCDRVRGYGQVGLWLLVKPEEGREAMDIFEADAIETNGQLKPM